MQVVFLKDRDERSLSINDADEEQSIFYNNIKKKQNVINDQMKKETFQNT